jgi:hypothetical protein
MIDKDEEYMDGYNDALTMLEKGNSISYVRHCSDYPGFSASFRDGFRKAIDDFTVKVPYNE